MSSAQNIRIVEVSQEAAGALFARLQPLFGLPKDQGDIEETARRLENGDVTLFVIGEEAYVLYTRTPRYKPFQRLNVPEIQDLNVHPDHRQQGLGRALLAACEAKARDEGRDMIGLGVGLSQSYGPAQRLYCQSGYLPDGAGLVYDGVPVALGEAKPNDDDLCLMMVKAL